MPRRTELTNQHIQILRIVAEGSAILISILLAFAIEEWSDQGDLRDREQEILRSLRADFEASRERLLIDLRFHESTQTLNLELLQAAIANTPMTDATLDQYLADLSWVDANSHIATGALNSVISGGELTTIRNGELRTLLADWPVQIETINLVKQQGNSFFGEKWIPYFVAHGYLPQLITLNSTMPGVPTVISPGESLAIPDHFSHAGILQDRAFHNLLAAKNWVILDYLGVYGAALDKLELTLRLLEQELL